MGAATASEVAAVLNQTLSEITALTTDPPGPARLVLRSHTVGSGSSVQVQKQDSSLVTLEGAPSGRLSAGIPRAASCSPALLDRNAHVARSTHTKKSFPRDR